MLYRNLMAMDVEETVRAYPLDAVVLLGGCDKTVPAQLMGAASVDVPAIAMTGGPMLPGSYRGRRLGAGTDLWHYTDELRAGRMTAAEYAELEASAIRRWATAARWGPPPPWPPWSRRLGCRSQARQRSQRSTRAAQPWPRPPVAALWLWPTQGPRPSEVLTAEAFDNAITLLAAIGGSTNAVVHLLALAGRVGVDLRLERFDELARRTPLLTNVRPAGEHLFEDLFRAGGVPAVLREVAPLLHLDAATVTGRSIGAGLEGAVTHDHGVIGSLERPFGAAGGLVVLRGTLAPDGAVLKASAATPSLLRHRGPAVVFEDIHDLIARIDDPTLAITPESVLVLRGAGPRGGPGMPEWGMLPLPRRLLADGVTDMVRVSDARMNGTGYGTCVLHVAPESAAGGPLLAVQDGDPIVLDVDARRLDLDVPAAEVEQRRSERADCRPRATGAATAPSTSTRSCRPTREQTSPRSDACRTNVA